MSTSSFDPLRGLVSAQRSTTTFSLIHWWRCYTGHQWLAGYGRCVRAVLLRSPARSSQRGHVPTNMKPSAVNSDVSESTLRHDESDDARPDHVCMSAGPTSAPRQNEIVKSSVLWWSRSGLLIGANMRSYRAPRVLVGAGSPRACFRCAGKRRTEVSPPPRTASAGRLKDRKRNGRTTIRTTDLSEVDITKIHHPAGTDVDRI